jgi:hypothetical protein
MSICKNCKLTNWTCLGCRDTILIHKYNFDASYVAMYCDCCDHNFICINCYSKNPGYNYWRPVFGNDHSVYDNISKESDLSRTLLALINKQK